MFTFNTANPGEFIQVAESIEQPYRVLRGGERWESTALQAVTVRSNRLL